MKKSLLFASVLLCMVVLLSSNGSAMDLSAGATTWYVWNKTTSPAFTQDTASTLYWGPVMSARLSDDFSLSFVFLYGQFDNRRQEDETAVVFFDQTRMDSDLTLNYSLNTYFKIYLGGKYMRNKFTMPEYDYTLTHDSYGPGAGISVVLPLGYNFYILGNAGGLYLLGTEKASRTSDKDYYEYGFNTSLSLSYYIEAASTTISLGGRYQYIKTAYKGSDPDPDEKNYFYGVTLSLIYNFNI